MAQRRLGLLAQIEQGALDDSVALSLNAAQVRGAGRASPLE